MRILSKNYGFSLIQVMIAVGLISVVSLGVAELMGSSSRASKSMNTRMERVLFYNELSNVLSTEKNCTEAIKNSPFNLTAVNSVNGMNFTLNLPGLGAISTGADVQNTNLNVESLTMHNAVNQGTGPAGETVYTVDLKAKVNAKSDLVGGGALKPGILPSISVAVNSSNQIVSCSSSIGVAYLCQQMNGTYDFRTNKCSVKPTAKDVCDIISGNYNSRTDECDVATAATNQSCGSYNHGETWRSCTGRGCGGGIGKYTLL